MMAFKFALPRANLDACAEEERTLFLLLGHFSNQAGILGKWVNWCRIDTADNEIERDGRTAQSIMTLSLFAAKLNEGWELLQKQYFGSKLSKEYTPLLDPRANEALNNLGRYFGSDNVINSCRNSYAFHFDPAAMRAQYATLSKDEPCHIWMMEAVGLSLYQFAEAAAAHSLLSTAGQGDNRAGMLRLVDETLRVSGWFQSFVAGFMYAFFRKFGVPEPAPEEIKGLPNFDDVVIPYLAEI